MITPIFNPRDKKPLYEQLYLFIRTAVEDGGLRAGDRLPSKRKLAGHLRLSVITVENAYAQLLVEGYIRSEERKGYFVCDGGVKKAASDILPEPKRPLPKKLSLGPRFDLKTNAVNTEDFPYSTWARLMRLCMNEDPETLLQPIHPQGDYGLRVEIALYLWNFRGVKVKPEQIILGAGTEYLLGLICELLPDKTFALEDPGYYKIRKILQSRRVAAEYIPMEKEGMDVAVLRKTAASVAVVTPSHHFPMGTVMTVQRRRNLLEWADKSQGRYVIEDDFDSEFRFSLRPVSSLQNLDPQKVIYLNSFAKTLAPSLRIAYMVLPEELLKNYRATMMFYSCTVSAFIQHTLKAFLHGGYYERHLNRMRNLYRLRRDAFIGGLKKLGDKLSLSGREAGLHLLLKVPPLTEASLLKRAEEASVIVYPLSGYYHRAPDETHTVVAGFGGLKKEDLEEAALLLTRAWK